MRRQESNVNLVYAVAAAYLRSQGMLQKEIADALGIAQPAVSRYLKDAEKYGWLQFLPPLFTLPAGEHQGVWKDAEARFFTKPLIEEGLKDRFREGASHLRRVTVLHGEPDGEDLSMEQHISSSVVDIIKTLLCNVKTVGVTWGRTISRLVVMLRGRIIDPPRSQDPIKFVPLCGEPLKDRFEPLKYSSSALAAQFSTIFNGRDCLRPPSLAGVPAFIPSRDFKEADVQVIRRFLRQVAGYAEVMDDEEAGSGPSEPLVNHLGAILTSVGVVEKKYRGIFLQERVEIGDITEAEIKEYAVGDMGGIIIPKRGLSTQEARHIDELNQRWTGIKQRQIEHCAKNANDERPGVILLAIGERRCHVVMRCIELGLVNELVIDQALAQTLETALKKPARRQAASADQTRNGKPSGRRTK